MPPRRPRRRARRRSSGRPVTLLIVVVVLLAIVVGGLTQVSRQSTGYDANSDRTLAAQGTVAADQSNATSATVRKVANDLPSQTRQGLQAALDGAVQQTSDEAARAQLAAGSTPLGSVATQFVSVFADRAQAVAQLRYAGRGERGRSPVGHRGDEPHCRRRRAPVAFRRALPLGAPVPGHSSRGRKAAALGLGDRPAGVATRQRGGPGGPGGDLVDVGSHALCRPAHGAPQSSRPPDAAG